MHAGHAVRPNGIPSAYAPGIECALRQVIRTTGQRTRTTRCNARPNRARTAAARRFQSTRCRATVSMTTPPSHPNRAPRAASTVAVPSTNADERTRAREPDRSSSPATKPAITA